MSKMIQLRNVPDALHRTLKARAALAGMSLSDYLLAEIREIAERPTLSELRDRVQKRGRVALPLDTAHLVHEERLRHDSNNDGPGRAAKPRSSNNARQINARQINDRSN